jgi:hypothetical protein
MGIYLLEVNLETLVTAVLKMAAFTLQNGNLPKTNGQASHPDLAWG